MEVKTQNSKKSGTKKKEKFQLNEAQLGYLMVAPAILIILAIALYPVARSFWYSLFDLRLNHPQKNEIHLKYQIDLERYFNNYDLVAGPLKSISSSANGDTKQKIETVLNDMNSVNSSLLEQGDVKSKADPVKKLVDNFQSVDDVKIKFAEIDKETAEKSLDKYNSLLKTLPTISVNKDSKNDLDKAAGLMQELRDSIVSPNFVGASNYSYFIKDDRFWGSLGYTFQFTVISVFLELSLGIMIALLINKPFKGRGLVRAAVLIPWAIPTVVSAKMWKFMYDGQFGIVSHALAQMHILSNSGVLLTTQLGATFSVVFADVWKTTPYMALLVLAGLQGIDGSLYEASDVDGATKIQQFFKITLPLLKPSIMVALLFRTLDAFRVFDLVYVLTGGANGTETISSYAYKTMFSQMEFGRGSSLSVIVFICVALISMGYIKILGAEVLSSEN